MRNAALALVASSMLAVGCGGGEDGGSEGAGSHGGPVGVELIDRLPSGEPYPIAYTDFVALRAQLGLPEDADPGVPGEQGSPQNALRLGAAYALPYLQLPPPDAPFGEIIDGGQVQASAATLVQGEAALAVIQTEQPFDEIAAAFEEAGFERQGDLFVNPHPLFDVYEVAADAGDGVIVLGDSEDAVEGALGEPAEHPASDLLAEVEGAIKAAALFDDGDCLSGFAIGASYEPFAAEAVLQPSGAPDAKAVKLDDSEALAISYEVAPPEVDANQLRVPISLTADLSGTDLFAYIDQPSTEIYAC